MSQERLEPRPETSKCSRLDKRRMASQNQQRLKMQVQNRTTQNFYQPNYKGMTLEQYFRSKQPTEVPPPIKHKQSPKPTKKLLVTSNDFFSYKDNMNQDLMRRTYMAETKYLNMKEELSKRFQDQDKELMEKYANRFELPPLSKNQIDALYGKLK